MTDSPRAETPGEAVNHARGSLAHRNSALIHALRDWPVYPVLLGAAYVIGLFASSYFPILYLSRPLLVTAVGITLMQLVLMAMARDRHIGAAATAMAVALAAGIIIPLLFLPIWAGGRQLVAVLGQRRRPPLLPWGEATPVLNVFALAWLIVAGGFALPGLLPVDYDVTPVVSAVAVDPHATIARPDVYVILLDAYARGDTLTEFGFSNEAFLGALEERGFDVYRDSTSNYPMTILTVPSILQMEYIHDFSVLIPPKPPEQDRVVWEHTNRSAAVSLFRALGYDIYSTASHSAPTELRDVDRYLDHGYVNEFEGHLLQGASEIDVLMSLVARSWLSEQHRSHVLSNLADLDRLAREPSVKPRFVWAHIMSPHPPFVFRADGSLYPPPNCFPLACTLGAGDVPTLGMAEFVSRYTEQVAYLDTRVSALVDEILDRDARSVIVILSDHGSRYDPADPDEESHNLFAAYTPGHPRLFGDAPAPVNTLRLILGAYFAADAPPI